MIKNKIYTFYYFYYTYTQLPVYQVRLDKTTTRARDSCVRSAPGCLRRKSANNVRWGLGLLVKYRGKFIYICKRHHLDHCKPPTPRQATLGRAPDSQQSGPGLDPIVWRRSDMVCIQRGRQRSKFSSGSSSVSLGRGCQSQ